jgi:hypothetical protein
MTRVGYDADTQIYTYRDSDGSYWEGAPGVRYGKLHRVQPEAPPLPSITLDSEGEYDDDDWHDSDSDDLLDEKSHNFSEKDNVPGLTRPDKAKIHRQALPAGLPVNKTLPRPDDDADVLSLSGTTVRGSICTTATSFSDIANPREGSQNGSGLKRSGTLSRLARFLSSASSSSSSSRREESAGLRRAATVGGRSSGAADHHRQGNNPHPKSKQP